MRGKGGCGEESRRATGRRVAKTGPGPGGLCSGAGEQEWILERGRRVTRERKEAGGNEGRGQLAGKNR